MRIAVVGAGIIGTSAALALAGRGHEVTLIDREGIAAGASQGNAGAFAFADVIPLATPGIMKKAPGWLLDPDGPLSVRPGYALKVAPWLWQFWRASRPSHYAAALGAQTALMALARDALERQVAGHGLGDLLRREGQLQLYDGRASFEASRPSWEERGRAGVEYRLLEGHGAIGEIQPGLAPRFEYAGFVPGWINVTDPKVWTERIAGAALAGGVRFERADVKAIVPADAGATLVAGTAPRRFDRIVLAAGAWSGRLFESLGVKLPLDTERGYNTTLPAGAFDLRTQLTFSDHGFVVTRLGEGVRVGGGVELGGLDLPPRMSRAEALLTKAKAFLPGLKAGGGRQWMGFRPSMPDSLPVIGPAPGAPAVILAFGHGHLGLTQSAATAEIVADMVDGRRPAVDPAPYAPDRFGGR